MTRRSRLVAMLAVLAMLGAGIALWLRSAREADHAVAPAPASAKLRGRALGAQAIPRGPGMVVISGAVIDEGDRSPVGGVEVVFRGAIGESTAKTAANGTYAVAVMPGVYRAFVRDAAAISVGVPTRLRLDNGPHAETARAPDLGLMPMVVAREDARDIELGIIRAGTISGTVVDGDGGAVRNAIVRARGDALRPVLGTDIAQSDATGKFVLRVAPGRYVLDASHPSFAGVSDEQQEISVAAGAQVTTVVKLVAGCAVSGRVVRADDTPASDGAIEIEQRDQTFGPAGRVEPDGTFRWATREEIDITLRAWPWKSAPSDARAFSCREGARFDNVVLKVPARHADLQGVLVDASGAPVPLGELSLKPADPTVIGQDERTDAGGTWQIYDVEPGKYEITATAPGRGIVVATITAPGTDVRLQLGGTGRIAGTTTRLTDGSFEASFLSCTDALDGQNHPLAVAREARIVTVKGGRFSIDDAPACHLMMLARWRGKLMPAVVLVTAGDTAHMELDIGPPHDKRVHGIVRDTHAQPVANARVTAVFEGHSSATTSTDATGHYSVATFSGASLVGGDGEHTGNAVVGLANVADEQVDLVLGAPGAKQVDF